jgi:hypothetical protein
MAEAGDGDDDQIVGLDDESSIMTDADFERALDRLREEDENGEVSELLSMYYSSIS